MQLLQTQLSLPRRDCTSPFVYHTVFLWLCPCGSLLQDPMLDVNGCILRCRDELGCALQRTPPRPAFFEALREELSASSGDSTATTDGLRLDEAGLRALVWHTPIHRTHVYCDRFS